MTLLNSSVSSSSFLVASLEIFMYSIISFSSSESFISFPTWIPFTPFSSLMKWYYTSLRLPKLCWIKVVRVKTLVLFPILEEMLSVFHHWEYISTLRMWVGHIWTLLCWGIFTLWTLLKTFYHKWVLNFVKCFFSHLLDDHGVEEFVNMVSSCWFVYIEEPLHHWYKSHLFMVYDAFNVLLDLVC